MQKSVQAGPNKQGERFFKAAFEESQVSIERGGHFGVGNDTKIYKVTARETEREITHIIEHYLT